MSDNKVKLTKSLNFVPKRKPRRENSLQLRKINNDFIKYTKNKKNSLKSDNKIIDYSETLKKLLGQLKAKPKKTSSIKKSLINDSYSSSNSSEIGDDRESEENKSNKDNKEYNNISPKKNQNLKRVMTHENKKKISIKKSNNKLELFKPNNKTQIKLEKSPTLEFKDFYNKKDSLILKYHRYFFQDGDIDNIDTKIKYNINKIKIDDDNKNQENENILTNENNIENDTDIFNIKSQVINLMDKFDEAFTKDKKELLISAIHDLNGFSKKYKFSYVEKLTIDWIQYLNDKTNINKSLKYFGYYNQIRDIMDKMLKEIKKKVDLIILYQEKKYKHLDNKENIIQENEIKQDNERKTTINKDDLLKSKEIVPIKLDIDIQNRLSLDDIEGIIKDLEKGDFGNIDNKNSAMSNKKKLLKTSFNLRNDNEIEAFAYPFKEEDNFCIIF